jgi:hypothetical protein
MLNTDLKGLWLSLKYNNIFHLIILLAICWFLYYLLSRYVNMQSKNNFEDSKTYTNLYTGSLYGNKGEIPKIDEVIIRNMIDLPNRNPKMLTSSMVVPELEKPTDEERRRTRMDILNMFYNSFDDDATSIQSRPQNLYVIP